MKRALVLGPLAFALVLACALSLAVPAFAADAYEPDDTTATAALIAVDGTPQSHEITAESPLDIVRFDATAGRIYKVKVTGIGNLRLSWVTASLGDGTPIAWDLQTGPASTDTPFYLVTSSSEPIYVKVAPEGTGPYTISVWEYEGRPVPGLTDQYEPDNIVADASTITTDGVPQIHAVEGQLGRDWIRFPVTTGMYYAVSFAWVTGYPNAEVDLYDAKGTDLLNGYTLFLPGTRYWRATYDGYAYATVWNQGGGPGATYGLAVQEHAPAAISGQATFGQSGAPFSGAIVDLYHDEGWPSSPVLLGSAVTDASGAYSFQGLSGAWTYRVSFQTSGTFRPTLPVTTAPSWGATTTADVRYFEDDLAPSSIAIAPSGWQKGPVTVMISATDNGPAGINRVVWYSESPAISGNQTTFQLGGVGPTTINYRATDNVGNEEAGPVNGWNTVTVYPDEALPVTTAGVLPAYLNSATFKVTANDQGSGIAHAWRMLDGLVTEGAEATVSVTKPGAHVLKLWSEDKVGNSEATHTAPFVVHAARLAWTSKSATIRYKAKTTLSGTFSSATTTTAGRTIRLKKLVAGGTWAEAGQWTRTDSRGRFAFSVTPDRKTYYRAYVASVPGACATSSMHLLPEAAVGTPVVPTLRVGRAVAVYGDLRPQQPTTSGVYVYCYHYELGAYRYMTRVRAKVTSANGISRYTASVKPSESGWWRYRTYFAGSSLNASTFSGYRSGAAR
jgi:hypothetical protein